MGGAQRAAIAGRRTDSLNARHQTLDAGAIVARKARELRAVAIEDGDELAARDDRHHDLRARRRVAGDVIVECLHVVDHDRHLARRGRAADAAARRQARARGPAGKRSEHELARRRGEIEAGPVDAGELVTDERREVGGVGDEVALAGEQRAHLVFEQLVRRRGAHSE